MPPRPSGLAKPGIKPPSAAAIPQKQQVQPQPASRPLAGSARPAPPRPVSRAPSVGTRSAQPVTQRSTRPAAQTTRPPPPRPLKPAAPASRPIATTTRPKSDDIQQKFTALEQELDSVRGQLNDARMQLTTAESTASAQKAVFEQECTRLTAQVVSLESRMAEQQRLALERETQSAKEIARLETDVARARAQYQATSSDLSAEREALAAARSDCARLQAKWEESERKRRIVHNEVMDLRGRVRCYCRVRPGATDAAYSFPEGEDGNDVEVTVLREGVLGDTQSQKRRFAFDRVFSPSATQETVFEDVALLVTSVLDGYDVSIFAYGQTGSGKTHTMVGNVEQPGIVPRTARQIFEHAASYAAEHYTVTIQASVVEIYNNQIADLLSPDRHVLQLSGEMLQATTVTLSSAEDVLAVLEQAERRRRVASTNLNEHSSRSHTVFRLLVRTEIERESGIEVRQGLLSLIDLAGSERWERAHSDVTDMTPTEQAAHDARIAEMKSINSSLSALATVIQQLAAGVAHVSYRNSILTRIMQPSLSGSGKCCLIVCVGGGEGGVRESLNTLNFGQSVQSIDRAGPKRPKAKCTVTPK